MSPRGGQQNFPFGYQPENLHGIGLPEFITPGPPPGQPLLNAHENQDLDNFFQGFDQNAAINKNMAHAQYNVPPENDHYYDMPPMFVGSDTALMNRAVIDPHQLAAGGFPYGHSHNTLGQHDVNAMAHNDAMRGAMHRTAYTDPAFHNPLLPQLQSAASMQPAFTQGWQQSYPAQNMMNAPQQGRLGVPFGTDARFQPSGYAAPHNPMDPDLPQGLQMTNPLNEWLEPASASTTQPNTRPNTQPSSPNWSKKRNFDDYTRDQQHRNRYMASAQHSRSAHPSPPHSNPRRKRSVAKTEAKAARSAPSTPLSKPHTPRELEHRSITGETLEQDDQDEDAEAEDEEDAPVEQPKSPSPAPWPGSRPRPRTTKAPPPKPPRKKKHTTISTPPRPKKPQLSQKNSSSRTPLSVEQKKANHTNSEQRRRDATACAYAELYDLVPELEDVGKQSTMKKLELVVAKVRSTKERVQELRAKLGMDSSTGRSSGAGSGGGIPHMPMQGDISEWRQ